MILRHFDPKTFEVIGESLAKQSPLEENVYLFPANSYEKTGDALPEKDSFAIVYENGTEAYVKDLRGQTVNNPSTKEEKQIDYLGEIKEGWEEGEYQKTQEEINEEQESQRWIAYNDYRFGYLEINTTPTGNKYHIDEAARKELIAEIQEIDEGELNKWRESDGQGGYINYEIDKIEMEYILKERKKLVKAKFNEIFGGVQ